MLGESDVDDRDVEVDGEGRDVDRCQNSGLMARN